MGSTSYDYSSRSMKTASLSSKDSRGNFTRAKDDIFEQNKKRQVHESMDPSKAVIREARDSVAHPYSVPVILVMDMTGSMQDIPEHLIREGLPKLISKLMKKGVAHPSVMVMGIDDSRVQRYGPFQVGQFESGDKEMDMWFERLWLTGNGGGNGSESYNWAYYFANNHVVTDAWEKRKEKGFIFTIGDDHCQSNLTTSELKEVMGDNIKGEAGNTTDMVKKASEQWYIHHINLNPDTNRSWKELLGDENVHEMSRNDYDGIAEKIADLIASRVQNKDFSMATADTIVGEVKKDADIGKTPPTVTPML